MRPCNRLVALPTKEHAVDTRTLDRRLDAEGIVALEVEEWEALQESVEEVESHPTFLAGDLVIVRLEGSLAAVEEPRSTERVVRRLPDEEAARRFVEDRLQTYERTWDGCGCKVEYYRR